ncbi:serpin (serine proteinase inhibitor) superfamily protein [Besnoitia besnoiti]|uniref:Serpin (Serine proteinase inhibitor) superfamily protein n=1 Tax=Besnoitia besnoiti TaxID=94643 RepID=A0A2A9MNY3_BESBE|nr:serpin (serine proteinase inhibitor) superfamily protein [Besnoitia besnoiti]PFH38321.1 serpin (serine proteinase inhibitor) superfamily protein [Besnoitia besnoiti]
MFSSIFSRLSSAFVGQEGQGGEPNKMVSLTGPSAELQLAVKAQRARARGGETNFVLSPFSVLLVFAMAMRGANGPTLREMQSFLKLSHLPALPQLDTEGYPPGQAPQLALGNRVYVQHDLESNPHFKKYVELLKKESADKIDAAAIDFSDVAKAVEEINAYVAKHTNDHIKNLLKGNDVSALTRLVLVSAMFFKSAWEKQFPHSATKKGTFHALKEGQHVAQQVDMMTVMLEDSPVFLKQSQQLTAIALKYAEPSLRMYIIQPHDVEDLATIFDKEKSAEKGIPYIETLVAEMNSEETAEAYWGKHIRLTMPKFSLRAEDNREDLIPLFRDLLKIKDMFDPAKADFSKITGDKELFVSSYLHAADISVDEDGTVATAATAMAIMLRSMPMPREVVDLVINRPFIFQIRYSPSEVLDGSRDTVLFSGQIVDVAAAQAKAHETRAREAGEVAPEDEEKDDE